MRGKDHRGLRQLLVILALTGSVAALIAVFGGASKPAASPPDQSGFIDGIIGDIFASATTTLTVGASGQGSGTITTPTVGNDGNGLNCTVTAGVESGDCSDSYTWVIIAPTINLSFNPAAGSVFSGSSCGGSAFMNVNVNCQGTFALEGGGTFLVQVATAGGGNGSITGPGINCTRTGGVQAGDCSENVLAGSPLTLLGTADAGSAFDGFSGDCAGNVCNLVVDAPKNVTGTFSAATFALDVSLTGAGSGAVSSDVGGIACVRAAGTQAGTCSTSLAAGTVVNLTATAGQGSSFAGSWGGACAAFGSNPVCQVTVNGATAVSANFVIANPNACTITGTNAGETINGTAGRDVICARGGNDVIRGRGGNDLIRAGNGNDVVRGQRGRDVMVGGRGADTLLGGAGNDVARGGPGADTCVAETKVSC